MFGLTLPFEGIITPLYFLARQMGILNTRLAIVLPLIGLFMPFAVFWMRAHFVNMPNEISEAARVDGASTWDLFWRIHVPLARAPMASLGILMSVWAWNQFLLALVLVEDPTQRTMAGALGAFQGHYATNIPLAVRRDDPDPAPDPHRLHRVPAPCHHGALAGIGQGMTRRLAVPRVGFAYLDSQMGGYCDPRVRLTVAVRAPIGA